MVFVSFKKKFADNTRLRFFFFVAQTLGYMTKTLNQNIFFSNIRNQNIFLETNHNPPLQVKWSFPYILQSNRAKFNSFTSVQIYTGKSYSAQAGGTG
jgi:hypothetical protein